MGIYWCFNKSFWAGIGMKKIDFWIPQCGCLQRLPFVFLTLSVFSKSLSLLVSFGWDLFRGEAGCPKGLWIWMLSCTKTMSSFGPFCRLWRLQQIVFFSFFLLEMFWLQPCWKNRTNRFIQVFFWTKSLFCAIKIPADGTDWFFSLNSSIQAKFCRVEPWCNNSRWYFRLVISLEIEICSYS